MVTIAALSLLGIGQVVRQAYVEQYASFDPSAARLIWNDHPDVAFKDDLAEIARVTAAGQNVPQHRIDDVMESAARAPLAIEPFLVRGVQAAQAGRLSLAGAAFEAARRRNPRSVAARYFLAEHYLKTNKVDLGLNELAALTKLVPNSLPSVAPYYAAFARTPGGAARTKAMLRAHPEFADTILAALAADPRNAELILFLAGKPRPGADSPAWHGQLVQNLVSSGQYGKAHEVWARLARVKKANELLFDSSFSQRHSIPPFAWSLTTSGGGAAEPEGEGRLHVSYYGRDDLVLAKQLLLLKPGRYLLSMRVNRQTDSRSVTWKLTCRPSNGVLLDRDLGNRGGEETPSVAFDVPRDCPAQLLELLGAAPEFPATSDLTISDLSLAAASQ
jgi:hypothetical protein